MTAPQTYNVSTESDSKNVQPTNRYLMWLFQLVTNGNTRALAEESLESAAQEEELLDATQDRSCLDESLHEKIDAVVLDLSILAGSLGTVGELIFEAGLKRNSSDVGLIVSHYSELIVDGLEQIEGFLTDDMRKGDV